MEQPVPVVGCFRNVELGKNAFPAHHDAERYLWDVGAERVGAGCRLISPKSFEVDRREAAGGTGFCDESGGT